MSGEAPLLVSQHRSSHRPVEALPGQSGAPRPNAVLTVGDRRQAVPCVCRSNRTKNQYLLPECPTGPSVSSLACTTDFPLCRDESTPRTPGAASVREPMGRLEQCPGLGDTASLSTWACRDRCPDCSSRAMSPGRDCRRTGPQTALRAPQDGLLPLSQGESPHSRPGHRHASGDGNQGLPGENQGRQRHASYLCLRAPGRLSPCSAGRL